MPGAQDGVSMTRRLEVLLVNADTSVCQSMAAALRDLYEVRMATGFRDAVGKVVWRAPDVIVADVDLEPYRGDDLLAMVARELPDVRRVLYTDLAGARRSYVGVAHATLPRWAPLADLLAAISGD
jgi:DNA-binding NtrC family response regulator